MIQRLRSIVSNITNIKKTCGLQNEEDESVDNVLEADVAIGLCVTVWHEESHERSLWRGKFVSLSISSANSDLQNLLSSFHNYCYTNAWTTAAEEQQPEGVIWIPQQAVYLPVK